MKLDYWRKFNWKEIQLKGNSTKNSAEKNLKKTRNFMNFETFR